MLPTAVPQILEVGCFTDVVAERALPDLYANHRLDVDWYNLRSMVTKCAEGAHARDYKYFGIQFYGECFGSRNGSLTFNKYKKGGSCMEGIVLPKNTVTASLTITDTILLFLLRSVLAPSQLSLSLLMECYCYF